MDLSKLKLSSRNKARSESLKMKAASGWDILADALKNFGDNGDANQAAAIALYAVLSAIPLFILTIILAGHIFSSHPHIQTDIVDAVRGFHPYFSEKILVQLGQIEKKKHLLGWLGLIGLIWASAQIFNSMEAALNITFHSQKKRNYIVSKLMAIAMIPMAWIVAGASVSISYLTAMIVLHPIELSSGVDLYISTISGVFLRYLLPYLFTVIFFSILYRVIPTAKIKFSVALVGGSFFALLMEIAKQFFTWYTANYTSYDIIFGSLEAVVILVIWVFYVALIFLFCAEIMSSYQRRDILLLERAILKPLKKSMRVEERLFKKFGQTYEKDSIVFNEGDGGHEMFYVLSGRVYLEKVDCHVKKVLAEMGPGQYFGEMAALIEISRSATAHVVEDSHLAVIDGNTFSDMLRESREIAMHMLKEFSRRLKNSNMALEELTNLWTRMAIVIHFMDNHGANIEEQLPRLTLLTKKQPQEIREILNELAQEGMVIIRNDQIMEVVRGKMWALLDSGALKKCTIDDIEKI
jgi:membrane protein